MCGLVCGKPRISKQSQRTHIQTCNHLPQPLKINFCLKMQTYMHYSTLFNIIMTNWAHTIAIKYDISRKCVIPQHSSVPLQQQEGSLNSLNDFAELYSTNIFPRKHAFYLTTYCIIQRSLSGLQIRTLIFMQYSQETVKKVYL